MIIAYLKKRKSWLGATFYLTKEYLSAIAATYYDLRRYCRWAAVGLR